MTVYRDIVRLPVLIYGRPSVCINASRFVILLVYILVKIIFIILAFKNREVYIFIICGIFKAGDLYPAYDVLVPFLSFVEASGSETSISSEPLFLLRSTSSLKSGS